VTTRATTIRLPEPLADELDLVARVDGVPVSEAIRLAISAYITRRRADPQFRERLRARIEADRRILERLAAPGPDLTDPATDPTES
jgi:metal-responsive CopG/Arc/MetJ family transcriptional regulator